LSVKSSPPVQTVVGCQQSKAAIHGSKSCACHSLVTERDDSPPRVQIEPDESETTIDAELRAHELFRQRLAPPKSKRGDALGRSLSPGRPVEREAQRLVVGAVDRLDVREEALQGASVSFGATSSRKEKE